MGSCGRCLAVVMVGLVIASAYILHVPVPAGSSEPVKLRLYLAFRRMIQIYLSIMEFAYGFEETIRMNREAELWNVEQIDLSRVEIYDTDFDGVRVRIYTPQGGPVTESAIIHIHGGGFVYGSLDGMVHAPLVRMTARLRITVISVGYRKAPEYPYPKPFQDCETAVRHFLLNADKYGVDAGRVAIMGDSAGGTLAAAVALSLRNQEFHPRLKLQILLYPALQAIDFLTPSYVENTHDPMLDKKAMVRFWLLYSTGHIKHLEAAMENNHTSASIKSQLSEDVLDHHNLPKALVRTPLQQHVNHSNATLWEELQEVFLDPYFAPLMADVLTGLPQTYLMTLDQDILRDDGLLYAQRLRTAGNQVTHRHSNVGMHGLLSTPFLKDHDDSWEEVYQFIEKWL